MVSPAVGAYGRQPPASPPPAAATRHHPPSSSPPAPQSAPRPSASLHPASAPRRSLRCRPPAASRPSSSCWCAGRQGRAGGLGSLGACLTRFALLPRRPTMTRPPLSQHPPSWRCWTPLGATTATAAHCPAPGALQLSLNCRREPEGVPCDDWPRGCVARPFSRVSPNPPPQQLTVHRHTPPTGSSPWSTPSPSTSSWRT